MILSSIEIRLQIQVTEDTIFVEHLTSPATRVYTITMLN